MKKAAFYTLGCKVNQYETEAMAELFADSGYEIKEFTEVADVYVINTCSVTNMGDRKSRQIIRRAKKLNPNAVIAVTGCYAQTAPDEVLAIEGVNLVLGTKDRKNIVTLVEELNTESNINHVSDIMSNHEFEELQIKQYSNRTRAFIKIQEGCNQFCSYCIIPYARGPVRSRAKDDVVREIKELAHNGFKEIILVGIHVASYGVDLGNTTLESLIMDVDKIDGVERIRLSSIEPMTLNQEFIDSIKDSKKLCHHFHISLQSGCDETLKRMNRKYTTAQFKGIVDGLREAFNDVAITTDIMVGFPDETDKDFEESLKFAEKIGFSKIHVFPYSVRPGTKAAEMKNQVSENIKAQRAKIMKSAGSQLTERFMKTQVGMTVPVLFERESSPEFHQGFTPNYTLIKIPAKKSEKSLRRMIFYVKIVESKKDCCIGELVKLNLPTV